MTARKSKTLELIPLGMIGGPNEIESFYPNEMMRLGTLSAYWGLVEDSLSRVLGALLLSAPKAEAAFYSTSSHKARRDMVRAVAARSNIDERAKSYFQAAVDATSDAAEARNILLHGLFKMEPYSGKLVSVHKRSATKKPEFTRSNVKEEIDTAIQKCELAVGLLGSTVLAILTPKVLDQAEARVQKADLSSS